MFVTLHQTCSNRSMAFQLGPPELDAVLKVESCQSKGAESSPSPAVHPALDAALDALGLQGSRHTLKQNDGCGEEKKPFQYYSLYRNIKWICGGLLQENLSAVQVLIWQSQEFCFFIIRKRGQNSCVFFLSVRKLHFYGMKLLSCWNHTIANFFKIDS